MTSPRENGTNPRAMGTNPRAKGTNPRAMDDEVGEEQLARIEAHLDELLASVTALYNHVMAQPEGQRLRPDPPEVTPPPPREWASTETAYDAIAKARANLRNTRPEGEP